MFKTGISGNPQGRKKGAKNRVNSDLRKSISDFIDRNIDTIQDDYEQLQPNERLQFMEKLFKFVLPTFKSVEHKVGEDTAIKLPHFTEIQIVHRNYDELLDGVKSEAIENKGY